MMFVGWSSNAEKKRGVLRFVLKCVSVALLSAGILRLKITPVTFKLRDLTCDIVIGGFLSTSEETMVEKQAS